MMMRTMACALILSACGLSGERADSKLQSRIDKAVSKEDGLRHALLRVDGPEVGLQGAWAAGQSRVADAVPSTPEDAFLSASVGKLFTATTVMVLVDEGTLSLDDPITTWLDQTITADLPVEGGAAALDELTLRMLLTHRSGLPDYFESETHDGRPNLKQLVIDEPDRTWTPQEVLGYTKAHFDPVGAPGSAFHYADTNYDLLGLIIESASEQPLHEAVRTRVIEPAGLDQTWYHQSEDAPDGLEISDAWFDDHNVVGTNAMSVDWAGGGLATTTQDLTRFMRALQEGQPIALDRLRESWTEDAISEGLDYGLGLWRIRPRALSPLLKGMPDLVGVSGVTGSFVYLDEEGDTVISGTFDQTAYAEDHVVFIVSKVQPVLARVQE